MVETVEQYLKGLKFKKRIFGGVDEESVLVHIKKICDLYHEAQKEEQKKLETSQEELHKAKDAFQGSQEELEKKKTAYADLQTELAKAQQSIRALREEREQAKKEQETALEMKAQHEREYREFHDIMETIQNVKKEAIVKAQIEAAKEATRLRSEMMAKVEEKRREAETEIYRLQQEINQLQQHRDAMQHIVKTETESFVARIRQMESSLEALKGQAETLGDMEPAKGEFTALRGNKSGGTLHVG